MPLNLAYVAAHTPRDQWEVDLIDETRDLAVDEAGQLTFGADLVGITSPTYQAPRAYLIAEKCRENGIPVVMGGTHATTTFEEASGFVDAVVVGEAEGVWPQLLADFDRGASSNPTTRAGSPSWTISGRIPTGSCSGTSTSTGSPRSSPPRVVPGDASSAASLWRRGRSTGCATSTTSSTRWRRFRSRA